MIADGYPRGERSVVGMNGGPGIRKIRRNIVEFRRRDTIDDTSQYALRDLRSIHH